MIREGARERGGGRKGSEEYKKGEMEGEEVRGGSAARGSCHGQYCTEFQKWA